MSDQLTADLREDEGEVLHAYQDHLGYWTIGVGILIDGRKGGGITREESAYLLANRIASKTAELTEALPWVADLDAVRRDGLLNMAFQLGVPGLLGFHNSLALIKAGRYDEAGAALEQSKWHSQTPDRADRVIKQIVTGSYRR
jgi:lysozyme